MRRSCCWHIWNISSLRVHAGLEILLHSVLVKNNIDGLKPFDISIITASNGFFINKFSLCRDLLDQLDLLAKMG